MQERSRKVSAKERTSKPGKAGAGRSASLEGGFQDYSTYSCTGKERGKAVVQYLFLDAAVSYLFFYSWTAFVCLLPGVYLFLKERKKELQRKRQEVMKQQFLDGIQLMSASLQAGYSSENALREMTKELAKVYGEQAYVVQEFRYMEAMLSMNRNLEDLLLDFGRRSGIDDIRSFAEVFLTAKRTGGDLMSIIRNTVVCIRQKQETIQEIETCLAGKKMEQTIMSLIPLLILAYIKFTSPEFLAALYGNTTGTAVMLVCFLVYAGAYFWGKRIVQIEV